MPRSVHRRPGVLPARDRRAADEHRRAVRARPAQGWSRRLRRPTRAHDAQAAGRPAVQLPPEAGPAAGPAGARRRSAHGSGAAGASPRPAARHRPAGALRAPVPDPRRAAAARRAAVGDARVHRPAGRSRRAALQDAPRPDRRDRLHQGPRHHGVALGARVGPSSAGDLGGAAPRAAARRRAGAGSRRPAALRERRAAHGERPAAARLAPGTARPRARPRSRHAVRHDAERAQGGAEPEPRARALRDVAAAGACDRARGQCQGQRRPAHADRHGDAPLPRRARHDPRAGRWSRTCPWRSRTTAGPATASPSCRCPWAGRAWHPHSGSPTSCRRPRRSSRRCARWPAARSRSTRSCSTRSRAPSSRSASASCRCSPTP